MKNKILLATILLFAATALFLTGCSKDDTTPPAITVTGNTSIDLPLNSSYTDEGATATDDEDGSVTVTSDASTTNPNVNHAGTYTITYTTTDAAGNQATATRIVTVYNQAEIFAGTYANCVDTCVTTPNSQFSATVTASDSVNRLVSINNFGANGTGVNIWVTISDNTIGAPITFDTPQSLGGNSSVVANMPSGSSVVSATATSTSFDIHYQWSDGTALDVCTSNYIR